MVSGRWRVVPMVQARPTIFRRLTHQVFVMQGPHPQALPLPLPPLLPPPPPLGIDGIDAHIAWVTAQQQHTGTVASTWRQGPAHSSSLPPVLPMGSWYIGDHCASSDDPVIPFVSEPLYMCPNIY